MFGLCVYRSAVYCGLHATAMLRRHGRLRYRVLSVLLGLLLLTAAVLKTHQLATEPVLGTGLLESRWFLAVVVEYELLLGFWLFSGLFQRTAWWILLATFAGFAVVAAAKAVSGEASCGCFGRVATPPWLVLVIDVCAILALCWCRVSPAGRDRVPSRSVFLRGQVPSPTRFGIAKRFRAHGWLVAAWFTTGMGLAFFAHPGARSEDLAHVGKRIGDLIIVEPERMQGQPFELGKYIDSGDRLTRGSWLVVFYHSGCPKCETLMKNWAMLTSGIRGRANTAFISVPPDLSATKPSMDDVLWGTLEGNTEWFVPTPLVVALRNNQVLDARIGLDESNEQTFPGIAAS
jgi:hypothetical protein